MEIYEWQNCTQDEIGLFESFYSDGDKRITMQGVSLRLRKAYEDYYAYRKELDNGKEN